jgi:hypothetical protein
MHLMRAPLPPGDANKLRMPLNLSTSLALEVLVLRRNIRGKKSLA